MDDSPRDFRAVFDAIGAARMCELLGVTLKHLRQLRYRNSLAAEHWEKIANEAEARGLPGMDVAALRQLWVARRKGERGGDNQALS